MIWFSFSHEFVLDVGNVRSLFSPDSVSADGDFKSFTKHGPIFSHVNNAELEITRFLGDIADFKIEPLSIWFGIEI